jgi:stage II sporulation protein D
VDEVDGRLSVEPTIRIGLTTDARSAHISSGGRLSFAAETAEGVVENVADGRVRVESRVGPVPPRPASPATFGKQDEFAGRRPDRSGAAGTGAGQTPSQSIRLSSRAASPLRSAVIYGAGAEPIVEARSPIVFTSADEAAQPLRFNDKPYRGRIEVFANLKGALTVVNVVGLEDYLRGVVPNELSPGGFPAVEALKAQAVAARTYAVANLKRFEADGFDLLPTTRSQVYGGRATEHAMTDRAVFETRGRVVTHEGRPINALYTSTCGGHTEDGEKIFGGDAVPYLRAHACAADDFEDTYQSSTLRTSRDLPTIREPAHHTSARDTALLALRGYRMPSRLNDEWLSAALMSEDVRAFLAVVAALTRQRVPAVSSESVLPGGFASALALALDGESRGRVLLSRADVEYALAFRDAGDIPEANRADVAQLVRDGHMTPFPDGTIRPRRALTRARAAAVVRGALEARDLFGLQRGFARHAEDGTLTVRAGSKSSERGAEKGLKLSGDAFVFRAYGDALVAAREIVIAGGEAVTYRLDAAGMIDYLEVRPAPNGASADRTSAYSRWTVSLTPSEAAARLARHAGATGPISDLRVRARGVSGRVLDLEVVGERATGNVRGGAVRTALGLREQLFVIHRNYDADGRVALYTFEGRGWGHGVGMCQVGAYGLAKSGLPYDKILKTYYADVRLKRLY